MTADEELGYTLIQWSELRDGAVIPRERMADVFDLVNRLHKAGEEKEKAGDVLGALADRAAFLRADGFDGISQTATWALYEKLHYKAAEIKKKVFSAMPAGIPNSTGSPSGPSGPADPPPA